MDTAPKPQKMIASRRRVAPPRATSQEEPRGGRGGIALLALLALLLGIASGVLLEQRRYHAIRPILTVNGTPIDREYFRRRLSLAADEEAIVKQMVEDELALQFARQKGVAPTDAEIETLYAQASKKPGFTAELAASGQSLAEFKRQLRFLQARYNAATKGVTVTDGEVRRFYDANIEKKNPQALYYTPEKVQVAVIVTKTQEQSKKARADLDKGIPWPTVVKRYSRDQSKDNNGVLPPIPRGRTKMTQIKGLEETLFGLRVGQQVGPMSFAGTWWIIRCLDKTPEQTRPFLQVEEECKNLAKVRKLSPAGVKRAEEEFVEFRKRAAVQAFQLEYRNTVRQ